MDVRRARFVTLGGLAGTPTVLLLILGTALGFALNGLLLGLFTGAGVAGAWEVSRRWARGFESLTLPAGGALGAATVVLAHGVLHPRHVAAGAAFGWGIGLAAYVILLLSRPRPWPRIALASLAGLSVVWLSLGIAFAFTFSFSALLVAVSLVLAIAGVEVARDLVRAEGRLRPVT